MCSNIPPKVVIIDMKMVALLVVTVTWITCTEGSEHCRCSDSNAACWPTSEDWNAFNVTIGGRLIAPKPTGSPCHDPHFDAAMCRTVRDNRTDSYMRADRAGSMQYENWEGVDVVGEQISTSGCATDAPRRSGCHQGRVSVRGVRVQAVDDVQSAIRFAARHNLRVVVKSSGHDFLGRSAAAGSFLIWMHNFKGIRIHESWGGSCGGYDRAAITVTGGVPWGEVYDALNGTGYIVVGGMSLTVAATGGYVQGGGHSALSPSFGLAVDNVLQMEVVTADGTLRVTNACQEPDLFFALRGGGGGTFGVVISVTYKLHSNPPNFVGTRLQLNPPNGSTWTTQTMEEILTLWSHGTVPLDADRWAGYWSFNSQRFTGNFFVPGSESTASEAFTPLVKALSRIDNVTVAAYSMRGFATFQDWHRSFYDVVYPKTHTDYTGSYTTLGSRIIPLVAVKESPRRVAKSILAALAVSGDHGVLGHMVIGPGVRNMGGTNHHTSVTPAWREGVWHLTTSSRWSWNATEVEKRAARIQTRSFAEVLHSAFPGSGAYVNEASVDEPHWARSFWGRENYAKLVATKSRVDPHGLFVCRLCVGSEFWDRDGNCRQEWSGCSKS